MALRLHEAAHDTVAGVQTAVKVGNHGGDDGVVRSLSRRQHIRVVFWLEGEVGAAVLQREAAALGDDGGAEAGVVGDDEAAGVAFGVGDAEVDGVGGEGHGRAVMNGVDGFVLGEGRAAVGEVSGGKKLLDWNRDDIRVGDEVGGIGETEAEGFDDGVGVSRDGLVGEICSGEHSLHSLCGVKIILCECLDLAGFF